MSNPAQRAHEIAKELTLLVNPADRYGPNEEFYAKFDEFAFSMIEENVPPEVMVRIMRTLLRTYDLPIEAEHSKSAGAISQMISDIVMKLADEVKDRSYKETVGLHPYPEE